MKMVTGGSGFIGRYLIQELIKSSQEQIVSISLSSSESNEHVNSIPHDISKEILQESFHDTIDVIFHLAATIPTASELSSLSKCIKTNIQGTLNLLEFARINDINRFIYSSSISVYKLPPISFPISENHCTSPNMFYGLSKLGGEILCKQYASDYGIDCTILRYSSVYGFGKKKPNSVLDNFLQKVLADEPPLIFGAGKRTSDFVYVEDVAHANILAYKSKRPGIYNIASGEETSMIDLASKIIEVSNSSIKPTFDSSLSEIHQSMLLDDSQWMGSDSKDNTANIHRLWIDISKSHEDLGYKPRYSLTDGLIEYIDSISRGDAH